MKAKKVKDLASELIDDLLGNKVEGAESAAAEGESSDETLRLGESQILSRPSTPAPKVAETKSYLDFGGDSRMGHSNTRPGLKVPPYTPGAIKGTEAALVQSENLRIAQQKIFELERETERLRGESEKLAAAGETFRHKADEMSADNEFKTRKLEELKERHQSEKEILEESLKARDREIRDLKQKVSEYELRLTTSLQKVRVRERELENRLEIIKVENGALSKSKDEMILEMKRQVDHLTMEIENFRLKSQDLNRDLNEKQEALKRTVKALRLALSMLEGSSDDSGSGQRVS